VLDVVPSSSAGDHVVATPLAQGNVELIDKTNLNPILTFRQTPDHIISHSIFDKRNPNILWVSNKDGSINSFDRRTGQIASKFICTQSLI
jgi:hypothetical protein